MLQQTQIKTALPYFERWMTALPDFAALAAAPESSVLKLWEGLGYYSRARNLRRLAQALTALPAPPATPDGWQELPGVGPYTAAAIASLSFGARVACVDGNVVRVLARLTADTTEFRNGSAAARHFGQQADALVPAGAPGEHNQAMMELGALVCRRQDPCCATCAVRPFCAAAQLRIQDDLPRFVRKRTSRKAVTRAWCEDGGSLLLKRADTGARRLAGLYELPTPSDLGLDDATVRTGRLLLQRKRGITNQQITELIHAIRLTPARRRRLDANTALRWIPWAGLADITLSGPHRRWVEEIRDDRQTGALRDQEPRGRRVKPPTEPLPARKTGPAVAAVKAPSSGRRDQSTSRSWSGRGSSGATGADSHRSQ